LDYGQKTGENGQSVQRLKISGIFIVNDKLVKLTCPGVQGMIGKGISFKKDPEETGGAVDEIRRRDCCESWICC